MGISIFYCLSPNPTLNVKECGNFNNNNNNNINNNNNNNDDDDDDDDDDDYNNDNCKSQVLNN